MQSDYADKNRYSFDESRNLPCVRECRVFTSFCGYNIVIGNYRVDFSTPFPILFLQFSTFRRILPEGKRVTGFSVAFGSLQHGYQRLTTICASLCFFKLCSLL